MPKKKAPRSTPHEESLYPMLRDDPKFAQEYLNVALEDEDPRAFLLAVKDVAEAYGLSKAEMAAFAGITREHFYHMLSNEGNPRWGNIRGILKVMGAELTVKFRPQASSLYIEDSGSSAGLSKR